MNISADHDSLTSCTDNENEAINITLKFLLLSTPSGVLLLSLFSLFIWTFLKPFLANK